MIHEGNRGVTLFHNAVVNLLCEKYPANTFFDDFSGQGAPDLLHYSDTVAYIVEIKSEKETKKTNRNDCNQPDYNYKSFSDVRKKVESLKLANCIARWLIHLAQLWHYGENLPLDTAAPVILDPRTTYLQLCFPKCYVDEVDDAIATICSRNSTSYSRIQKTCSATDNIAIYTFPQAVLNSLFTAIMQNNGTTTPKKKPIIICRFLSINLAPTNSLKK